MSDRAFIHLRKSLLEGSPPPSWPTGTGLVPFDPARHAAEVHALLADAYATGGGSVEPFEAWWPSLRDDAEFDPSLVFIALDTERRIAGAAQCWTSGYVKDLAVARPWRRQGLGQALLLLVFQVFRERGAERLDLKVDADNPSGAARLYRRLGMRPVVAPSDCQDMLTVPHPRDG